VHTSWIEVILEARGISHEVRVVGVDLFTLALALGASKFAVLARSGISSFNIGLIFLLGRLPL
jgi:hypothetical protein